MNFLIFAFYCGGKYKDKMRFTMDVELIMRSYSSKITK